MNQLIAIDKFKVDITPAVINANFDEVTADLDAYLGNKLTIITEESIKGEKNDLAEMRKVRKGIADVAKKFIDIASADIEKFKQDVKQLDKKIADGITDKDTQIKELLAAQKRIIHAVLIERLTAARESAGIKPEFCEARFTEDDANLTDITPSGKNLSASGHKKITDIVQAELSKQNLVQMRLMAIENACLKAEIPMLSLASYQGWYLSDTFDTLLDHAITSELERKQETEARLQRQLQAEQQHALNAALAKQKAEEEARQRDATREMERLRQEEANRAARASTPSPAPRPTPEFNHCDTSEQALYTIHAMIKFDISMNERIPVTEVENYARNKLLGMDILNLRVVKK